MKIVQSFAQFDTGCMYAGGRLNGSEVYLNFYTFLLSFLTLRKYYKSVTMYCNKSAYNTFIKYIPYDEVVIKENKYDQTYWSAYKLDVIADMKEDFIHVDSDVFIFKDLFKPFIEDRKKYNIIVQYTLPVKSNFAKTFVHDNMQYLLKNTLIRKGIYDDRCHSCGVVGMNLTVRDKYIENTNKIYKSMINNELVGNFSNYRGMVLEEVTCYLTAINSNFTWHNILSDSDITRYGVEASGAPNGYTHMWFDTKFVRRNIELIKNKIKKDFGEHYHLVDVYDSVISMLDIKYLSHIDNY